MRFAGEVDLEFQGGDNNEIRRQLLDTLVVDTVIQAAEIPQTDHIRVKVMFELDCN